jgi:hypothetical protein
MFVDLFSSPFPVDITGAAWLIASGKHVNDF